MEYFNSVMSRLNQSPFRGKNREEDSLTNLITDELNQIISDAETIIKRSTEPLNLVIMGEVKAGKSSIVNAIINDEVTPVDVAEATSCIIDISHDLQPSGIAISNGKVIKTGSPEEIVKLLNMEKAKGHNHTNIDEVKLCYNLTKLRNFHIIDTPGLSTVNIENEDKTIDYVEKSDVIIWVFNANHLGQSDIREIISSLAKLGKPILGIINRIDEVNDNAIQLTDYVKNNYSLYLQKVFTLSAKIAKQASFDNDQELLKQSGMTGLLESLHDIDQKVKEVKRESSFSSMNALVLKDKAIHELALSRTKTLISQLQTFRSKVQYYKDVINYKLDSIIEDWFESKFLKKEIDEIMRFLNETSDNKEVQNKIKQIISQESINNKLSILHKELKNEFIRQWTKAISEVSVELSKADELHLEYQRKYLINLENDNVSLPGLLVDGIKKGATIGGALGLVGGSFVVAMTAVTMPALLVFIPVYSILGMLTGGIANMINIQPQKDKKRRYIQDTLEKIKNDIYNSQIIEMKKRNADVSKETANDLEQRFLVSTGIPSEESLISYQNSIEIYLKSYK
jgi:GTPase SAR1 family protein